MSARTLFRLFGLTGLAVALAVVAYALQPRFGGAAAGEVFLPALQDRFQDIERVVVEGDETVTLQRAPEGETGWRIEELNGYPADAGALRALIAGLANTTVMRGMTADPARYRHLDLAPPGSAADAGVRVRVFAGGTLPLADMVIGRIEQDPGTDLPVATFVRRIDDARAFKVRGGHRAARTAIGWVDGPVLDIAPDRVVRVVIRHPDGETVAASRRDSGLEIVNLPPGFRLSPLAGSVDLEFALSALKVSAILDKSEAATLPGDPVETVVTTADGLLVRAAIAGLPFKPLATFTADVAPSVPDAAAVRQEAARINRRVERYAFELPLNRVAPLVMRLSDKLLPVPQAGSR